MTIDYFYNENDKSHFYLGMISQVYRDNSIIQVENLTWLNHRKIKMETLIPNTINFYVVIDTTQGLFFGEIFQSKISSSDNMHIALNRGSSDKVFPELGVDLIGIMQNKSNYFKLTGTKTVGITDKVYIANSKLVEKYLDSLEIKTQHNQNEHSLKPFSHLTSRENQYPLFKPSTLFNRHLMAVGTTNSGKSTSSLSILDKLVADNKKILMIDPTGEYKETFSDDEFIKLTLGEGTVLSSGELSSQQWEILFETNDNTQGAILSEAMNSLRFQEQEELEGLYIKAGKTVQDVQADMSRVREKSFDLSLLPEQINQESVSIGTTRDSAGTYVFDTFRANTNSWLSQKVHHKLSNSSFTNFFSNNSASLHNLINKIDTFVEDENSSIYIDCSKIGTDDSIGGMIIDLISTHLLNISSTLNIKPFIIFIDEVHRYTKSTSTDFNYHTGLTNISREGRKRGMFLFLTTQNPNDVPSILLGQVGTLLIHRLTHYEEIKSIQNHLKTNITGQIKKLNQGETILTSINLLQDIHLTVHPCNRTHNNNTPTL